MGPWMGLGDVDRILSAEQQVLRRLLASLRVRGGLADGSAPEQWTRQAEVGVDALVEELRIIELLRAVEVDAVAAELGIAPGPTLAELAAAAPDPHRARLHGHRDVLHELAAARETASGIPQPSLADFLRDERGAGGDALP